MEHDDSGAKGKVRYGILQGTMINEARKYHWLG